MTLLFDKDNCYLIDHNNYISKLYENVSLCDQGAASYKLSPKLFSIRTSSTRETSRKRKLNSDKILNETLRVKQQFETFIKEVPLEILKKLQNKYSLLEIKEVREFSKQIFETTRFDHAGMNGGNNSDKPLQCKIKDEYFLIPDNSRFFCGCVSEQSQKLVGNKFDIVIADPPWWNKYIRRLKGTNDKMSYKMMYNEEIAAIPIKPLFSENCLIAVWCTNSPANINSVKDKIFPNWGVEYITTWYWIKVTVDLEPLCAFGVGYQKQPYERVILGKIGDLREVPVNKMFASVPSALHSHKPPLLDLLKPYLKPGAHKILELFARNLLPNTTSVGYEPLKWQHISLYEKIS